MINLEELKLYLQVRRIDMNYIDGYQLYDQFLMNMTQLKKFTFYIKTEVAVDVDTHRFNLPSNEDIQRSFIGRGYQQVASSVYTESVMCDGVCHIYSVPYDFEYYAYLDDSFPSGMFHKVRQLKMLDFIPFEYKLFQIISQDFPFLQFLYINNHSGQKGNEYSSTLITFPYLVLLHLEYAHVDYAKLFLFKQNTYLPRLLNLAITSKSLTTITNIFTNDATYFNFDKLESLDVCKSFVRPQNFHEYFPLL
jgi:hypothetical protein